MKKLLTILSVITILFHSCKTGETYTLKMRLKQGDKFSQQTVNTFDMKYVVMGQTLNMNMNMDATSDFEVIQANDSGKQVKMSFSEYKNSMQMKGIPGMPQMDSSINAGNNNLLGKSVTIHLSPDNQIVKVTGMEQLTDTNNIENDKIKKMLKNMFDKEKMQEMFGIHFSMYPDKPVQIGDKWKKDISANFAGMDMKIKTTYTLVSVSNGIASIKVDGVVDGKGKLEQLPLELSMKGTQKGSMQAKLSDGYLTKGNYDMDIKAEVDMMGQKMPINLKGNSVITGK